MQGANSVCYLERDKEQIPKDTANTIKTGCHLENSGFSKVWKRITGFYKKKKKKRSVCHKIDSSMSWDRFIDLCIHHHLHDVGSFLTPQILLCCPLCGQSCPSPTPGTHRALWVLWARCSRQRRHAYLQCWARYWYSRVGPDTASDQNPGLCL